MILKYNQLLLAFYAGLAVCYTSCGYTSKSLFNNLKKNRICNQQNNLRWFETAGNFFCNNKTNNNSSQAKCAEGEFKKLKKKIKMSNGNVYNGDRKFD